MISLSSFSGQGEGIRALIRQLSSGKMVHALLITGEQGLGKRTMAMLIAAGLLCKSSGERPCGICTDCKNALVGEHADMTILRKGEPISADVAKGRSTIPVDDIREMIRLSGERTLEGGARVFLIFDADKMTPQAQNCLLKTLEEPPENTYIIMVTDHAENLLTTIVSRCRSVHLKPWPMDYVLQVLLDSGVTQERARESADAAMGSIGKALELASDEAYWQTRTEIFQAFFVNNRRSDIIRLSTGWKDRKGDAEQFFGILESQVRVLTRYRVLQTGEDQIRDFPDRWKSWAREGDISRFSALTEAVNTARKQNTSNVNFQSIMEQLLFAFMGAVSG